MKISHLETHKFAPELNTLHLKNGVSIRVSGCTSIKQAREKLFKPRSLTLCATVKKVYEHPSFKWLESEYSGRVPSRKAALTFAKNLREQNKGGVLVDGSILPPLKTNVRIFGAY